MAKTQPLTPDDKKFIHSAAHAVWNEIAYDALVSLADMKGKDINAVSYSRADVVELVMDADRLRDQLRRDLGTHRDIGRPAKLSDAGRSLVNAYTNTDWKDWAAAYEKMKRIVRDAFPAGRHGM